MQRFDNVVIFVILIQRYHLFREKFLDALVKIGIFFRFVFF